MSCPPRRCLHCRVVLLASEASGLCDGCFDPYAELFYSDDSPVWGSGQARRLAGRR